MLMKALALAGVAFSCVSATRPVELPALTQEGIPAISHPEVLKVACVFQEDGKYLMRIGTAFRVGKRTYLTAAHVSHNPNCMMSGKPFKEIATAGDFSVLTMDGIDGPWLTVDCSGYVRGKTYRALGYARGMKTQTEVDVIATGESVGAMSKMTGVFNFIPGQSGGPVLDDQTGKVVGIVNTYQAESGNSGSVELKTTSVCKA